MDERDELLFDQFEEFWAANEEASAQAKASSYDNFRLAFDRVFLETVVRRMDDNEAIFKRILDDYQFQAVIMDFYSRRVFDRAREFKES